MPKYSYDQKCKDLAEHFLPDDVGFEMVRDLAQAIQDCVEGFLDDVEDRAGQETRTAREVAESEYGHQWQTDEARAETSVPHPPFGLCSAVINDGTDLCTNAAEPGTHRCKQHPLNRRTGL